MNITELSEKLKVDEQELFRRGYAIHGYIFGGPGPVIDYNEWKRTGTEPYYMKKYCQRWEKLKVYVNGKVP